MNMKKLILTNLPYVLFVYPFDKLVQAFRLAPGADLSAKILSIGDGFANAFSSLLPSFHLLDLLIGIAGAVILRLVVHFKGKNAKKYRLGMEYGSARWGTPADIAPFVDEDFFNNIPITQTERITMSSRPKQPKYARNKNILVIGGSGSGKTRFFCKPSLLQCHSSYVVTDPKGTILNEVGRLLERKKYRIKSLNLINFKKSMRYNPLAYIRSEKDILKLVNALIMNTKGEGDKSGEDFWVKAERLYYSALIGYIWYEATEDEKNFITLLDLINASEAREDDEEYQSPVDLLFADLEEKDPDHFAVKQYKKFKMAAGKTLKSILISCGARLAPFDIKELRELMEYDELELDTLGDSKAALFVIISDTDSTFNFVAALMYSQLFNLLCDKADDFYGGRLPVHVRLLLDEFANIGQIPSFDKLIATIRSREISASIILQSQSQLKAIYKDSADTIVGNCDSTLFLGGKEKTTLKEISELLGKETIDSYNRSENRGTQISHGLSYQKLGKELMTQDELAVMDGGKCIFMLRGVRPFFSDKYDLTKHPNYKYTADADPKNVFDMERYMRKQRAVVKPTDRFDVYEIDVTT
ncbi:VirD4-like conjugal transfer protein, CD1115 family [Gemmiger formicilis]|uniref:VirD4-like conjugal transfer protein, CD1115 family n=1 Tax=Gemmiger formicilis TaxID=745368 RepID=UPI003CCAF648